MKYLFKQPFFYTSFLSIIALGLVISSYYFGGKTSPYAFGWTTPSTNPPGLNITPQSQWTTSGNDIYYNDGNVGIGTTTPYGQLHLQGSAVKLKMSDTNSPALTSGLASEVGGQLLDFGSNYSQLGGNNASYPGGFFRIELRDAYPSQFFNIKFIPAAASETTPFMLSRTGDLVATGNLTISGTGNSSIAGNVGIGTTTPGYNLVINSDARIGTYLGVGTNPSTSYSITTAGDLNVGGNDVFLNGNKRISDSTSASYTQIQPQSNQLILYNGAVNDQQLAIYGASGSNGLALKGSATNPYIKAFGTSNSLSIYGGDQASINLTLDSTSNATKGYVIIAPSGGNVGIGTTTPGYKLDVVGDVRLSGNLIATANTLADCAWTAYTCDASQTCASPKVVTGVERYTTGALCGTSPTQWYQMRLYCCNL